MLWRAQSVFAQRISIDPTWFEKIMQNMGAFNSLYPCMNHRVVVKTWLSKQIQYGTCRPRSGIVCPKHNPIQTGMQHCPTAHGTRLQSDVKGAAFKAVITHSLCRSTQGHHFGMRGGIATGNRKIVSGCQQTPPLHHHCAHGHFTGCLRLMRLRQGKLHPGCIFINKGVHSFSGMVRGCCIS